jgi:hypothetical protein
MPDTVGRQTAEAKLREFINEARQQPAGSSLRRVVEGIDPNGATYLGREQGEPGDLLVYAFRFGNASAAPTFRVLVGDYCAAEVNW